VAEPPPDLAAEARKRCSSCGEEIFHAARKCRFCGSFQDYRRHLTFSSTVLALLVALVSVLTVLVPLVLEALEVDRSRTKVRFVGVEQRYFNFVAANSGNRPAILPKARLEVWNDAGQAVAWELEPRTELFVLEGGEVGRAMFRVQAAKDAVFLLRLARVPGPARAAVTVSVWEHDGKTVTHRFELEDSDLRDLRHFVQERVR